MHPVCEQPLLRREFWVHAPPVFGLGGHDAAYNLHRWIGWDRGQ
jgi:hypothetical protein